MGGTFDRFHNGHKRLIQEAFHLGGEVVIGITSDKFAESIGRIGRIRPIEERRAELQDYLKQQGWVGRYEFITLHDPYGPTITDPDFDAIVVSPETKKTAIEINKKRAAKRYSPLAITLVPWVLARDGKPIHATRIRAGEIGRDGTVFDVAPGSEAWRLPDHLRKRFKQPIGKFYTSYKSYRSYGTKTDKTDMVVAVGDYVTHAMNKAGDPPDIAVIDYHVERKRRYRHITDLGFAAGIPVTKIKNPAGSLTSETFAVMRQMFRTYTNNKTNRTNKTYTTAILAVDGEEDLLVLPAILAAPLDAVVVYGQPSSGIVVVTVTETLKHRVLGWLNEFSFARPGLAKL